MVTGLVSLEYCNRISCTQTRVQAVGEDFMLFVVSLQEFTWVSQMKIFKTAQNRDPTVCNCRYSVPSAPVSSRYCANEIRQCVEQMTKLSSKYVHTF